MRTESGAGMVALFFEAYGALCFFSLIAFVVLAAVAKWRPDLDEEEFEEIEKLRKLVSSEPGDALSNALSIEAAIMEELSRLAVEELSRSPRPLPAKQSKRPVRRRPHLFYSRKPRTI
jgi:hypothetical protein